MGELVVVQGSRWGTSLWHGKPNYSCFYCGFASLEKHRIEKHMSSMHNELTSSDTAETRSHLDYLLECKDQLDSSVTLGMLCWNTAFATVDAAQALAIEVKRFDFIGIRALMSIIDNGSEDGTFGYMVSLMPSVVTTRGNLAWSHRAQRLPVNRGISHARNLIIQDALSRGSEFTLLIDGDIEVIPCSVITLLRYLQRYPGVGCIGPHSGGQTRDRRAVTPQLYKIPQDKTANNIDCAWTQYGLFRTQMFQQGLRFDEEGPFGEPGWGFEDNDFCLQMHEKGWDNRFFKGATYLHRNLRSSLVNLREQGIDPEKAFHRRKDYLIAKWRERGLSGPKLQNLLGQQYPSVI